MRLVILVDFETDCIETAYAELSKYMKKTRLDWETSDEAYDSAGDPIDPDILNDAISKVLEEEER